MKEKSEKSVKRGLNIEHNLTDWELEETLEKALKNLKGYEEPDRKFPDKLANKIEDEQEKFFDKTIDNMFKEIQNVVKRSK